MNPIKTLNITMQCFLMDENYMWLIPEEAGILCKYDLESKKIVFMQILPELLTRSYAYSAIVKYENELILIPCMANKIIIFNMDLESFTEVELPDLKEVCLSQVKFIHGFRKEQYIYLIPESYPYFLRIDMKNLEMLQSKNVLQMCKDLFRVPQSKVTISVSAWNGDNTIYVGMTVIDGEKKYTCLGKIDLESFQFYMYMPDCMEEIKGMIWYKEQIFLYSAKEEIIILDQNMQILKSISVNAVQDDHADSEEQWVGLVFICVYEEQMFFIRRSNKEVVILDLNEGNTILQRKLIDEWTRLAAKTIRGLLIQPQRVDYFYLLANGRYIKNVYQVENKAVRNCFRNAANNYKDNFKENMIFGLSDLIVLVTGNTAQQPVSKMNSGEQIYQYIKKKI